jgi:hypothetical protein
MDGAWLRGAPTSNNGLSGPENRRYSRASGLEVGERSNRIDWVFIEYRVIYDGDYEIHVIFYLHNRFTQCPLGGNFKFENHRGSTSPPASFRRIVLMLPAADDQSIAPSASAFHRNSRHLLPTILLCWGSKPWRRVTVNRAKNLQRNEEGTVNSMR